MKHSKHAESWSPCNTFCVLSGMVAGFGSGQVQTTQVAKPVGSGVAGKAVHGKLMKLRHRRERDPSECLIWFQRTGRYFPIKPPTKANSRINPSSDVTALQTCSAPYCSAVGKSFANTPKAMDYQ